MRVRLLRTESPAGVVGVPDGAAEEASAVRSVRNPAAMAGLACGALYGPSQAAYGRDGRDGVGPPQQCVIRQPGSCLNPTPYHRAPLPGRGLFLLPSPCQLRCLPWPCWAPPTLPWVMAPVGRSECAWVALSSGVPQALRHRCSLLPPRDLWAGCACDCPLSPTPPPPSC